MSKLNLFVLVLGIVVLFIFPTTISAEAVSIYEAVQQGNVETVKQVLAEQPQLLNAFNENGQTPLNLAILKKQKEVVALLIEKGADINLKDKKGLRTPLHNAGIGGDVEIARMLIAAGADVNGQEIDGETPLFFASYNGFVDIVSLLIEKGAIVKTGITKVNTSPLIYAATRNHLPVLKLLVQHGADIHEKLDNGFTLLHFVSWNGSREIIEYLIEKGIPADIQTVDGVTPLHNACFSGNDAVIEVLLQKGANINAVGNNEFTPLYAAVESGYKNSVALLLKFSPALNWQENNSRYSALHLAALKGYGKIVDLLLEKGADVDIVDAAGKTPYYYAARYGNAIAAKSLLTKGAKTANIQQNFGPSPILKKQLKDGEAAIWYLGQSGWGIKTSKHFLIFDYIKGPNRPDEAYLANGTINLEELTGENILFFTTHAHGDHFMPEILKWKKDFSNITYIMGFIPQIKGDYIYIAPRETKTIDGVEITTIAANDSGVGFFLKVDGLVLFHPGDHANRKQDFSEPFKEEIEFLAARQIQPDLYFTPVSGCGFRDLEAVKLGAYYTIKKLNPGIIFPMHGPATAYNEFAEKAIESGIKNPLYCAQNSGDFFFFRKGDKNLKGLYTTEKKGACPNKKSCDKKVSSCNSK